MSPVAFRATLSYPVMKYWTTCSLLSKKSGPIQRWGRVRHARRGDGRRLSHLMTVRVLEARRPPSLTPKDRYRAARIRSTLLPYLRLWISFGEMSLAAPSGDVQRESMRLA